MFYYFIHMAAMPLRVRRASGFQASLWVLGIQLESSKEQQMFLVTE